MDVLLGAVVGDRYRITEKIGAGGMATVYRGEHQLLRKGVAIKILPPEIAADPEMATRFEAEAVAAAKLDHPNCVGISDFGRMTGGQLYLVMELIDGKPLSDVAGGGRAMPWQRAVELTRQILRGLQRAHELGILHRDLKPANIMIAQRQAGFEVAKIIDFGIAKMVGDAQLGPRVETRAGTVFGTADFIAPERLLGKGDGDPRSDLYAVGVTLYELVTGVRPFADEDPYAVVRRALAEQPRPPREVVPAANLPERLEQVILRALEKDPERRFASAREFLEALDIEELRTAAHPVVIAATRALEMGRMADGARQRRRRRAAWISGGVVALALLVLLGVILGRGPSRASSLAALGPPGADAAPPPDLELEIVRLIAQAGEGETVDARQSGADRLVALGYGARVPHAAKLSKDLHQKATCEERLASLGELEKLKSLTSDETDALIPSLRAAAARPDNDCLAERALALAGDLDAPAGPPDAGPPAKAKPRPTGKRQPAKPAPGKKPQRGGHF